MCGSTGHNEHRVTYSISRQRFGSLPDGRDCALFTLKQEEGPEVCITNYGGIITALRIPDRTGELADVVLGYDSLDGYLKDQHFLGALIGPYANRIENASFTLEGRTFQLASNDGAHHLHGGKEGFDERLWSASTETTDEGVHLHLTGISEDSEERYPGRLTVNVTYTLSNSMLKIDYKAETDTRTIVNLTNHAYFNLSGHDREEILNHHLMMNANRYTPIDERLIPTGHIEPVEGTPFDFTSPATIGSRIDDDHPQLRYGEGYDHNFVLNQEEGNDLTLAATVYEPTSGRTLTIRTTKPGIQFYSGNLLDGQLPGKGNATYDRHSGFCLEPQYFPNSPNTSNFPSPVLEPDETYRHTSIYEFGVRSK